MQKKNYTGIVPPQQSGQQIDAESTVEGATVEEARELYNRAKNRLLDINHWQQLAGKLLASFQLTDAQGHEVNRTVQQGDYLKIDIPGPGSKSGEGNDWVRVEAVEERFEGDMESMGIRVRPTGNPGSETGDTSHFYNADSTSNFTVTREGTRVTAGIYDRNIKPNTQAHNTADKIRNTVVGAGAMAVFSKIQWKQLAEGLLKKEAE
jgi:hypothetical protein